MYLLPQNEIIFYANPSTGSRSICRTMLVAGAIRIGDHHDAFPVKAEGWTRFCVVRPHHEVIASLIYRDGTPADDAGWESAYHHYLQVHCRGGRLYWRADFCNTILQYPDVRIPGMNIIGAKIGQTGKGARWREIVPESILDKLRGSAVVQGEYEQYGWEMP